MHVKVKPISGKMKSKVKEHGGVWNLIQRKDGKADIETLKGVHCGGKYPYGTWVEEGKDVEPLEEVS